MPFAEAVLLFSVFFLPGYFQQGVGFDLAAMLNPGFHLLTLLFNLPQMLLLIYILRLRTGADLSIYGIGSLRGTSFFQILLSLVSIFGITLFLGVVQQIIRHSGALLSSTGIEITPNFYATLASQPSIIILIAITCLLIGYFEELFFRVYLISEFGTTRRTAILTVLLGSGLFAAGHAYQGIIPAAATYFIGVLFGYRFLSRRSWHEIALAHALYNFIAILIMPAAGGV
ncbi:MAG: CPBP family intramembrane glutamic endopeptidase [Spirochaetota bacterium]